MGTYNYGVSGTIESGGVLNYRLADTDLVTYRPDYKKLTIRGDGSTEKVPYYENITVDVGGYLDMGNRARISAVTVLSGGTANGASWGSWKNVTVSSGGSVILNATKLRGSGFNMAEGTIYCISGSTIYQCASAYAVDGMFYNLNINLGIDAYDVKGFRNCNASALLGIYTADATVCNLTATAAAGKLYVATPVITSIWAAPRPKSPRGTFTTTPTGM